MPQGRLSDCKYSYSHHGQNELSQAIDNHDISVRKCRMLVLLSYVGTLLLPACSYYLLLVKGKLCSRSIWSDFVVIIFAKFLQYKPIKKDNIGTSWSGVHIIESVVIMLEFGMQLETHYWSGRISRHFVPMGKILRPVLHECVTPVICSWSLALILRGEEQLLLVFQELQPPLKMLVPVWKALCAATYCRGATSSRCCLRSAIYARACTRSGVEMLTI